MADELSTLTTFDIERDKRFTRVDKELIDGLYVRMMYRIGREAVSRFKNTVPFEIETDYHMIDYIHSGSVDKHAWGYSIDVGILPVEDAADPEYPKYVDQGSGIYNLRASGGNFRVATGATKGRFSSPSSALITPSNGNVMVFEKEGEGTIFTRWVKGQRGQHFGDKVYREMQTFVAAEKQKLRAEIAAVT